MMLFKCDRDGCSQQIPGDPPIYLTGYHPKSSSGILLPERFKKKHFCSHSCFVEFMRWALLNEPCDPSMDEE